MVAGEGGLGACDMFVLVRGRATVTPRGEGIRSSCASAGPAIRKLLRLRRPGWVVGTHANSSSGRGGIGTTVDRPRRRRRGAIVSQPGGTTTMKTPAP